MSRYTWVDLGSSFLPGELTAAFLWAQLEAASDITAARRKVWDAYYEGCTPLEAAGIRRPGTSDGVSHNAHLFYLLLPQAEIRTSLLADLNQRGVNAIFHYVPLHDSEAGRRYGRVAGSMDVTVDCSWRLIRLPLWVGMQAEQVSYVLTQLADSVMQHT